MVTVIDSPCGHGKTTYAINLINKNPTKNFVYITPFLAEIQRVKESTYFLTNQKRFIEPSYTGKSFTKLDSLIDLMANSKDIASTHALFKRCPKDLINVIKEKHYTLILDEVMDVVEPLNLKKDDLNLLLKGNCIEIDENTHKIKWIESQDYDARYNDLKELCISGNLYLINGTVIMWTFPAEIFSAFDDVIILTYMFKSQIQRYYYDLHNVQYEIKSLFNGELVDYRQEKDNVHLINMLKESKLNDFGQNKGALSKNWYNNNRKLLPSIKKCMFNFSHNIMQAKSKNIIWTTFSSYRKHLTGMGYAKGFVACNARSTNIYGDRHVVMYMVNRYLNPYLKKFFEGYNIIVDEDSYALSEMIQFIWRSAIRNSEQIYCYIPSKRMRDLLQGYIDNY